MHHRLAELIEYAGRQRAELLAAVDDVPPGWRDVNVEVSAWFVAAAAALAALAESRRALMDALSAATGMALGTITYPHPLMGPITLYQWILFVGQHELRHARQIRSISDHTRAQKAT